MVCPKNDDITKNKIIHVKSAKSYVKNIKMINIMLIDAINRLVSPKRNDIFILVFWYLQNVMIFYFNFINYKAIYIMTK